MTLSLSMLRHTWRNASGDHAVELVPVAGTGGTQFPFGARTFDHAVTIADFCMTSTPVTRAFWTLVMGTNGACRPDPRCPMENVSWDDITGADGFLARLNASDIRTSLVGEHDERRFRLPSEAEWEYAARGGTHWADDYAFSGSNNPGDVAWYGRKFSNARRQVVRLLGWRVGWRLTSRGNHWRPSRTQDVATKAPNQVGLYDMSGNVWEWCQDICGDNPQWPPSDGTPLTGAGHERRLRGGCHHNWDLHCTVLHRYNIAPDSRDGAIGFRLVLA